MSFEEIPEEIEPSLLVRMKKEDSDAWTEFFRLYDPLIRAVTAWSKWRFSPEVREDVGQGIRMELHRSLDTFKGESSFKYFVKRICIHRCIDEVRRQARRRQVIVPFPGAGEEECPLDRIVGVGGDFDPIATVVLAEKAKALRTILGDLDEMCRNAVRQFYFEGRSYKEMAERMGVSIITVGTRLGRCLNRLRGAMKKDEVFREEFRGPSD